MLTEMRIAGFGGQGVILAATIVGRAAALHENGYATMTQNFGPEARGGAASAALVLSNEPVLYPYLTQPDVLVVMSQEAYTRFTPELKPGGLLLVEEDLVRLNDSLSGNHRVHAIPATRLAEELGKKMVLNVVMVGFACAVSQVVSRDACRAAVAELVPPRFRDLNLAAFDKGFDYGIGRGIPAVPEDEHHPHVSGRMLESLQ
jgi:2-oxoglutarate ferredoxin oxidoreductase subunit gamma